MEDKKELKVEELEKTSGGIVVAANDKQKREKRTKELREALAKYRYKCPDCKSLGYNQFETVGMPEDDKVKLRCTSCGSVAYYNWESLKIKD